jgi:hypothetical protein
MSQADVDVDAFDVLAGLVVDPAIAEPTRISKHQARPQAELSVGSDTIGRCRDEVGGSTRDRLRFCNDVVGELVKNAGRGKRLPDIIAVGDRRANTQAGAAKEAFDVVEPEDAFAKQIVGGSGTIYGPPPTCTKTPGVSKLSTDTRDQTPPMDGSMNQPESSLAL